jgi:hypothetical protein
MEGKGRKWQGLSGLRCARLKFDCTRLGADDASWKHDGFDLPVSRLGPGDAVDAPGACPGLSPGHGSKPGIEGRPTIPPIASPRSPGCDPGMTRGSLAMTPVGL